MDFQSSGSPVLFLDVRDRNIHGLKDIKDRASLIDAAKKSYEEHSEKLFEVGLSDTFDVCAISFFHEVLFGDGDIMTTEDGGGRAGQGKPIPLHERILIDQRGIDHVNHDALAAPATSNQVTDTASWLADQIVRDAWRIRPKDGLPTERRTDQIPDETDDKTASATHLVRVCHEIVSKSVTVTLSVLCVSDAVFESW
jgi:hypothetical protein